MGSFKAKLHVQKGAAELNKRFGKEVPL